MGSPLSRSVRVNRLLLAVTFLLPALAVADVDPRFARLRDNAEPLGSLGTFLDSFIGECSGFFTRSTCSSDAEAFRKRAGGKPHYLILDEKQVAALLSAGPYQPGSGQYSIQVRPAFPGGGYTLTHGLPPQTDVKAGFFSRLPGGRLVEGLARLHLAARKAPAAGASRPASAAAGRDQGRGPAAAPRS